MKGLAKYLVLRMPRIRADKSNGMSIIKLTFADFALLPGSTATGRVCVAQ